MEFLGNPQPGIGTRGGSPSLVADVQMSGPGPVGLGRGGSGNGTCTWAGLTDGDDGKYRTQDLATRLIPKGKCQLMGTFGEGNVQ